MSTYLGESEDTGPVHKIQNTCLNNSSQDRTGELRSESPLPLDVLSLFLSRLPTRKLFILNRTSVFGACDNWTRFTDPSFRFCLHKSWARFKGLFSDYYQNNRATKAKMSMLTLAYLALFTSNTYSFCNPVSHLAGCLCPYNFEWWGASIFFSSCLLNRGYLPTYLTLQQPALHPQARYRIPAGTEVRQRCQSIHSSTPAIVRQQGAGKPHQAAHRHDSRQPAGRGELADMCSFIHVPGNTLTLYVMLYPRAKTLIPVNHLPAPTTSVTPIGGAAAVEAGIMSGSAVKQVHACIYPCESHKGVLCVGVATRKHTASQSVRRSQPVRLPPQRA